MADRSQSFEAPILNDTINTLIQLTSFHRVPDRLK